MVILPRQVRDKHRKTQKRDRFLADIAAQPPLAAETAERASAGQLRARTLARAATASTTLSGSACTSERRQTVLKPPESSVVMFVSCFVIALSCTHLNCIDYVRLSAAGHVVVPNRRRRRRRNCSHKLRRRHPTKTPIYWPRQSSSIICPRQGDTIVRTHSIADWFWRALNFKCAIDNAIMAF